jgi:hypothetical protein
MSQVDMKTYARKYLEERIDTFRKDMAICLTPDANSSHAYFPALLTCLSLLDLVSCLNIGDLDPRGMSHVLTFTKAHMAQPEYDDFNVTLLWLMFRHKTTHNSQPYGVFDTYSRQGTLRSRPRMKITWTVSEGSGAVPILLTSDSGAVNGRSPWPSAYSHRCTISLPLLQRHLEDSVLGEDGYLPSLQRDQRKLDEFARCIETIFPK